MDDGVCRAAKETLAQKLGVSRQTIIKHANWLVEHGYLSVYQTTGEPSTYRDTGKAGVSIRITGGVNEIDRGCKSNLQGGVNEIDTNKTLLRNSLRDRGKRAEKNLYPLVSAIADVTSVDIELNRSKLFGIAKRLADAGVTEKQIRAEYGPGGKWYRLDWRGKKGQKPTPEQVVATWGTLEDPEIQTGAYNL